MNKLNNVILNESKENYINTVKLKEPMDILNKELIDSKSLLENFFIKFNENKSSSSNNSNEIDSKFEKNLEGKLIIKKKTKKNEIIKK